MSIWSILYTSFKVAFFYVQYWNGRILIKIFMYVCMYVLTQEHIY